MMLVLFYPSRELFAQLNGFKVEQLRIEFNIRNMGVNVDGTLSQASVQGRLRPGQWRRTQLTARVPVKTLKSGIKLRDQHLMDQEYFHQEEHPYILFSSDSVHTQDDGSYVMHGLLTMKGKTQAERIHFTAQSFQGGGYLLEGDMQLNRLDYGIGEESMILSDDVRIDIQCRLKTEHDN